MNDDLKSRLVALEVLAAVIGKGQPLDQQLHLIHDSGLSERDRAFARRMVMTVLRFLKPIDAWIADRLRMPIPPAQVRVQDVLRLGVAQLVWMEVPPHAAIDSSVRLVKHFKYLSQAGLVNAVLRRISETYANMIPVLKPQQVAPEWLWQSWCKAYGAEQAAAMVLAQTQEPPLDMCVKDNVQGWAAKWNGEVIAANTVRLGNQSVTALEGYAQGQWWVQDVAASLPVALLGDITGLKILDLCAAPGGKTAQLVAAGATVTALDRSKKRLERLHENLARLHMDAQVICADVMKWQPDEDYDIILLDAPCSATGTMRRHPDILWQRSQTQVDELVALQREMLRRVTGWLKPNARLLYCVCSLQPEEGEQQMEWLLSQQPQLKRISFEKGDAPWINAHGELRTLPSHLSPIGGMDGFFAACVTVST